MRSPLSTELPQTWTKCLSLLGVGVCKATRRCQLERQVFGCPQHSLVKGGGRLEVNISFAPSEGWPRGGLFLGDPLKSSAPCQHTCQGPNCVRSGSWGPRPTGGRGAASLPASPPAPFTAVTRSIHFPNGGVSPHPGSALWTTLAKTGRSSGTRTEEALTPVSGCHRRSHPRQSGAAPDGPASPP